MATRGQSHAPDRGADTQSAGSPPAAAIPPAPFPLVPLSAIFSPFYPMSLAAGLAPPLLW